jgi:26S proteasome regulatory subunit N13
MYSDLFDALGGGGGPSRDNATSNSNSSTSTEPKPLLSFKAGKVDLALQDSGKYTATPDTRRGQVNLKYNDDDDLIWEWYDRREKTVVDTIQVTDPAKLERAMVPKSQDASTNDRVYYWKLDNEWKMIWLQDKTEDPELIDKVNDILAKPKKPTEETSTAGAAATGPASTRSPASTSSVSTTARQVDALSNILENLGMPQGDAAAAASSTSADAAAAPAPAAGTLTLADLQGVMAGLQQQQQPSANPPGLHDIVTPGAITELLANEEVRNRLLQELPEEQRSQEHLEENLRSPQVQQTLRSLTQALIPDDSGSMEGYHSVLANFQLDAAAGQPALTESNNPIQAFLDCVLASVKKDEEGKEESKDEEMKE